MPDAFGPVRLDRFMAEANAHYYATRDPFADFVTAPEISQIFGEILGAWVACVWQAMGSPDTFLLTEAGPGRGTLMQDVRRCLSRVAPRCFAAAKTHLIETSPRLREIQAAKLDDAHWHERQDSLPPGPMVLLANEFLDALPIRQFVRRGGLWHERFVENGKFVERASSESDLPAGEEGIIYETSPASLSWIQQLAARLCTQGGAALIVDYGTIEPSCGDSLQALRDGEPADPLSAPGSADLTAHVDFNALAIQASAAGARVHGPVTQGDLLVRLGALSRLETLCAANPDKASALREDVDRLIAPSRMGTLFKILAVSNPSLPCLPGFSP